MDKKTRGNFAVGHPHRGALQPAATSRAPGGLKRKPGELGRGSRCDTSRGNHGNSVGKAGTKPGARPGKLRLLQSEGGKGIPEHNTKRGMSPHNFHPYNLKLLS